MKDTNYRVKRNNICVGILDKTDFHKICILEHVYDLSPWTKKEISNGLITESEAMQEMSDEFYAPYSPFKSPMLEYANSSSGMLEDVSRKGIIAIDENNRSNDLLFDAPHYPIFNVSKDEECLRAPISYKYTFKFDKILEYFNYPEFMTYDDVLKMKDFFLDSDFIFESCELFGKMLCDHSGWQMPDGNGGFKFFCNSSLDEKAEIPINYFLALYDTRLYDYTPKEYEGPILTLKRHRKYL